MPSLDLTSEALARVKNAVIVILVVNRPRYAISKHAFGQWRKRFDGVLLEEGGCRRRIALGGGMVSWGTELVEFVLRYTDQPCSSYSGCL